MDKSQEREELNRFLGEADEVGLMASTGGWRILKRDIESDRERIARVWAAVSPSSKEFEALRIQSLSNERLLNMVEDYASNRQRAMELLLKLENRESEIVADVDTATPLEEKDA